MNSNIDLTDPERTLLLDIARERLGELREQVHHSMTSTFTEGLKDTESMLRRIIDKLESTFQPV
jgi:hypothetical protein